MAFISHPLKPSHASSGSWLRHPKHTQHFVGLCHTADGRTASSSHPPKHRGIAASTAKHQLVNNSRSRDLDDSAPTVNGGVLKSSDRVGGNSNGSDGGRGGGGRKAGFRPHHRSVNNPHSKQFVKKVQFVQQQHNIMILNSIILVVFSTTGTTIAVS